MKIVWKSLIGRTCRAFPRAAVIALVAVAAAAPRLGAAVDPWPDVEVVNNKFPAPTGDARRDAEAFIRANMGPAESAAFDIVFNGSEPPEGLAILAEYAGGGWGNLAIAFLDASPAAPSLTLAAVQNDMSRVGPALFKRERPTLVRVPLAPAEAAAFVKSLTPEERAIIRARAKTLARKSGGGRFAAAVHAALAPAEQK